LPGHLNPIVSTIEHPFPEEVVRALSDDCKSFVSNEMTTQDRTAFTSIPFLATPWHCSHGTDAL
jgi:hypothetical protein